MTKISVYKITADYRRFNPQKPYYFIFADSPKTAKANFSSLVPWLKIYKVEKVSPDEKQQCIRSGIIGYPYEKTEKFLNNYFKKQENKDED